MVIQEYFLELCQSTELPDNPYPQLVRRFRLAEAAEGEVHAQSVLNLCSRLENPIAHQLRKTVPKAYVY